MRRALGGGGRPTTRRARGGSGAVSLSAPEGPGREGGERVSMAPGLRGLRGRWARSAPVAPGGAGRCSSLATAPRGLLWPLLPGSQSPVTPGGAEPLPRPPQGDAPRRPASPALQLLPGEPNFCAGFGLGGFRAAHGAQLGRWPERLGLPEMTSRLWLWCFCAWVAASWPPGSALQLQPGM